MKQSLKNKIENIISNPNANEQEMLFQLEQLLLETEASKERPMEIRAKSLNDLISENVSRMKRGRESNSLNSGFSDLDKACGGFLPGEMVVIGGRPGMGKTQLMVNLALNISAAVPVLYFTFDLTEQLLSVRLISTVTGIESDKLLRYELSGTEKEILREIESKMKRYKLFINDKPFNSMSAFKKLCREQIAENGVQAILIDSVQKMSSYKSNNNRKLPLNYLSHELKNIATENSVCLIATSQLGRSTEIRGGSMRPRLQDLRDRGAMEQDADKVIFIYRAAYYGMEVDEHNNSTEGLVNLIIAKNRSGNLGDVLLKHDKNFTTYYDVNSPPRYKLPQIFSRRSEIEFPELAQ